MFFQAGITVHITDLTPLKLLRNILPNRAEAFLFCSDTSDIKITIMKKGEEKENAFADFGQRTYIKGHALADIWFLIKKEHSGNLLHRVICGEDYVQQLSSIF
ncbi:hypothetical protein CHARACLAT_000607 [Characodon lateralis]|uniref:Uncharacterized protein n=1 Tax=Characodon lateralis TaxID=208331 RepID=A0ABU7DWJ4_9TELE|nr:hypothetical protein [Characodon lateralis]